jgi:hypothetical protein
MAVTAMLGFGVILGSLGHVSIQQLASAPSLILNLPAGGSSAPSGDSSGGASSSSGRSGGGTQVQTITVGGGTAPAPSGGSGFTGHTGSNGNSGAGTTRGFNGLPAIQHVFLIMLSQEGYNETFSTASADTYLNKTLPREGELVPAYYAVAGSPLANEIALLSGQGPTQQTAANCPTYNALTATGAGYKDQLLGDGCVYPTTTKTLFDQLTAAHRTWRAYVEGMSKACSHPGLGASEPVPSPAQPYAVWTNPVVFFQSLVGSRSCRSDDVGLGQLKKDLKAESQTPSFSYIAPSPCDDGSPQPCATGAPAGLGPADKFLRTILAEIKASPAYKSGGLILITADEAPQSGSGADSSSCCSEPMFPNLPPPPTTTTTTNTTTAPTTTDTTSSDTTTTDTTTTDTTTDTTTTAAPTTPPGGGQVGLLLISKWVKPNTSDPVDSFNHFSLLKGIEELFGLRQLGYAKASGLLTWTSSVFTGMGP